jgi:hypothetical protein
VLVGHETADGSDLLSKHGVSMAGDRPVKSAVDVLAAMRKIKP